MLEEKQGQTEKVGEIVKRAFKKLSKAQAGITRSQWLNEARKCEDLNNLECCKAIIQNLLPYDLTVQLSTITDQNLKEKEMRRIWIEEAKFCESEKAILSARTLLREVIKQFPQKKKLWMAWISMEENLGTSESLAEVMKESCATVTKNKVILVLKYSKHIWKKLNNPE